MRDSLVEELPYPNVEDVGGAEELCGLDRHMSLLDAPENPGGHREPVRERLDGPAGGHAQSLQVAAEAAASLVIAVSRRHDGRPQGACGSPPQAAPRSHDRGG